MKRITHLAAAAFAIVMAPAAIAEEPLLVGYWYSEDYQPNFRVTAQEVTLRRADGTYEDEFRRYEDCKLVLSQHESGTWTLVGDQLHTTTTSVNGRLAHFEDDYEVRTLTEKQFQYFHPKLGQLFTDTKVRANFRFPDCLTS